MILTITDTELQGFIGSTANLTTEDCKDDLVVALSRYALEVITANQLVASLAATQNQAIHSEAVTILKRAVCNLAVAKGYMKYALQFDTSGVKDATAKEKKASKEDKEQHRNDFWEEGFSSLEELRVFLEKNKTIFTIWANSGSSTIMSNSFLPTASVFQKYVDINDSRKTFQRLMSYIETCEVMYLNRLFSTEVLQDLKSKVSDDEASPVEKQIIKFTSMILANYAIADALIKGAVIKDQYGTFTTYDDTGLGKTNGRKTADLDLLKKTQSEYRNTAIEISKQLAQYMKDENFVAKTTLKEGLNYQNKQTNNFIWI